jgi:hypothetical protein
MAPRNVQLLPSDNHSFRAFRLFLSKVAPKGQREVRRFPKRMEPDALPGSRIPQSRIIIRRALLDKPMTRHSNTIP